MVESEKFHFSSMKSMLCKVWEERCPDKAERYPDKAERYPDDGGTLSR